MVVDTEVADGFVAVAHRIVWCTVATVDRHGRPRSRVLHPYRERTGDGLTGWITTLPTPLKVAHLSHSPYVSCSYWDATHDPGTIWPDGPAAPDAGVLRLTPWRLRVAGMDTLLGRAPVLTWRGMPR